MPHFVKERGFVRLRKERDDALTVTNILRRALDNFAKHLIELVDDGDCLIVEYDETAAVFSPHIGNPFDPCCVQIFRGGFIPTCNLGNVLVEISSCIVWCIVKRKRPVTYFFCIFFEQLYDFRLICKIHLFVKENVVVGDFDLEETAGLRLPHLEFRNIQLLQFRQLPLKMFDVGNKELVCMVNLICQIFGYGFTAVP